MKSTKEKERSLYIIKNNMQKMIIMKRRKVVGIVLLMGTFVYLFASLLALYQNQRVKMEKGIEEALKAYSEKESLDVKELSKDFNLLLDEKLDINDMNQQILKYEGSFARMEKHVTNVTDEMAVVEYNINNLNERMYAVENYYSSLYEEVVNMNTLYEEKLSEINNSIISIKSQMEEIKTNISNIEEMVLNNDSKQEENVRMFQEQIALCEQRLADLEGNALYFQYDNETQTLNVFGREETVGQ